MFNKIFLVLAAFGLFFSVWIGWLTGGLRDGLGAITDFYDFGFLYMIIFSVVAVVVGIKGLKGK